MVAYSEAQELAEKGFLTSSCCPAFVRYVKRKYPEVAEHISHNSSPIVTLGKYLKSIDEKAKVVFIGPCTAKKREALEDSDGNVDFVMTFEELQAVLVGKDIDLTTLEESSLDNASYFGRIFARIGGLSEAVAQSLKEQNINFEVKPAICEGIENIRPALKKIKAGKADFNFLEGMACMGGCIGGPCNITHEIKDKFDIDRFGKKASKTSIIDSLDQNKVK
jgi:iron only hydrogenase large subunit-like protein